MLGLHLKVGRVEECELLGLFEVGPANVKGEWQTLVWIENHSQWNGTLLMLKRGNDPLQN